MAVVNTQGNVCFKQISIYEPKRLLNMIKFIHAMEVIAFLDKLYLKLSSQFKSFFKAFVS